MQRFFDLFFALIILIPSAVFIAVLALLTVMVNRFLPFYFSKRIGKDGKLFTCVKLQTLKPPTKDMILNNRNFDNLRLTKLGKVYRNHGWDEFPQVFNILLGQMSFIGPRPILDAVYNSMKLKYPSHKKEIDEWKMIRIKYLPGLSGWHQVHLLDHNIIKYDYEFFKNPSFFRKLIIFYRSILIFVLGKNIFFGKKIPDTYLYKL